MVVDSDKKYSISMFFPCFNEQDNINKMVADALTVLSSVSDNFEVIIVNDGSSDNTASIADKLADENLNVKAVHHPTNLGYGAALQTGFKNCTKQLIFYTDGDCQFDLKEMPQLLEYIDQCDIVSCYRMNRKDSLLRKLNAFCWTSLVSILFKLRIKDIDCAFKLYKSEIFKNIKMESTGALIDTEILARAVRKGYKIKQLGVGHYPRTAGIQTGAKISVILRAFKELFVLYSHITKDA